MQTHEETTIYVKELNLFLTVKTLEDTSAILSLGKLSEDYGYSYEWTSGQKSRLIKNDIRIQCNTENYVPIGLLVSSTTSSSSSSSDSSHPTSSAQESTSSTPDSASIECEGEDKLAQGDPSRNPTKITKPNKYVDREQVRSDPYHSEIPELLQEFTENHVDERVPEHRDSHTSSSHELSLVPQRKVVSGNHSISTHFPKDWNYDICQRFKITMTPCRRRTGEIVPRAENFWWLDNSRLQRRMWISKQSSICNRGSRVGNSMDSIVSM